MCIRLWFNEMSEGDLGRPLRADITLRWEADARSSAKWCGDMRPCSRTRRPHRAGRTPWEDPADGTLTGAVICDASHAWAHLAGWRENKGTPGDNKQQKSACLCQNSNKEKHWSVAPARRRVQSGVEKEEARGGGGAGHRKSGWLPPAHKLKGAWFNPGAGPIT